MKIQPKMHHLPMSVFKEPKDKEVLCRPYSGLRLNQYISWPIYLENTNKLVAVAVAAISISILVTAIKRISVILVSANYRLKYVDIELNLGLCDQSKLYKCFK